MSEVLYIRLGSRREDEVHWLVWSDDAQEEVSSGVLPSAHPEHLSTLSERAGGREARVFVPCIDVSLQQVKLPGKWNRQMANALPFMLEDDLATDVESLFFAVHEKRETDGVHSADVAIVGHDKLELWLGWLAEVEIRTKWIVPDVLCMPHHEDGPSLLSMGDHWLMRQGAWAGAILEEEWLEDYLTWYSEKDEDESPTLHCYSPWPYAFPDVALIPEVPELPLALLVKNWDAATGFNLLQGSFKPKKETSKYWKTWRVAIVLAGITVVSSLISKGTEIYSLNQKIAQVNSEIKSEYKKAFPGKKLRMSLLKRTLSKQLGQANASDSASFLTMMDHLSSGMEKHDGIKPLSLRFDVRKQSMRVQASGKSFNDFEQFKATMEEKGYQVKQGALNNDGDAVIGTINLRNKA
ncbi:type II secretion system protein GspL [Algicola sagamiensis]|uniref:type II secretion system protein GspL n=1 Tax=Algicola sagamiensis TaxID=163869 RepID=UPI00036B8B2A|nr:type II secretion system protein GspL [Algicola sagamiensis]